MVVCLDDYIGWLLKLFIGMRTIAEAVVHNLKIEAECFSISDLSKVSVEVGDSIVGQISHKRTGDNKSCLC